MAVVLIKDFGLELLREHRVRRRSEADIYRQYLGPMSAACEKIMWRSREIFVEKRHSFLKTSTLPLDFNAYKRQSTLYRIATLVGWIRGMSLELSAAPHRSSRFIAPIAKEISAFQKALADGPHVERRRLDQMCAIWAIDLSALTEDQLARLAMRFEIALHTAAGGILRANPNYLRDLTRQEQITLCTALSAFLCESAGCRTVSPAAVEETIELAIGGLSYREALLYRDWQDALGDAMLVQDADSTRRFKIIGYEAFGELLKSPSPWIQVLATSIDDIDFDEVDPNDFRSKQLQDISAAVAAILIRISESKDDRFLVDEACLQAASALREAITLSSAPLP